MTDDPNVELKEKYLAYFLTLPIQKLAADHIGRSPDTIQNWMKDDTEFSAKIASAKAEFAQKLVRSVRSKEWLLERIMREHFGPTATTAVQINNFNNLTDEQLDQLIDSKAKQTGTALPTGGEAKTDEGESA